MKSFTGSSGMEKESLSENYRFDITAGSVLIALVAGMALLSLVYMPYDYNAMDSGQRFSLPGRSHLLGTDNFGRDVFSRIMAGARYTLMTALITVTGSAILGTVIGLASGYSGGLPDEAVMRLMDIISSFPGILFALAMAALLGGGEGTLIVSLLVLFIPGFTRISRSGALEYKNRDFVLLVRLQGASHGRIILRHILPNLVPNILSALVLGLSNAIMAEATMSYLGLGIQPPVPSWGRMLSESQNFLFNAPWCALSPGVFIMLTVIAFHALGEGLKRRYSAGRL
ncbi:MAG: ABC transporter permease [Treponema sp.]|nr:ABC transporter permease [Treponema sp.]